MGGTPLLLLPVNIGAGVELVGGGVGPFNSHLSRKSIGFEADIQRASTVYPWLVVAIDEESQEALKYKVQTFTKMKGTQEILQHMFTKLSM